MGTNIIAGKGKEAILRAYRFSPEKRNDYTVPPCGTGGPPAGSGRFS
ncbi:MAG: hypothetical protein HXY45_08450 [Syntrophaceae bacterium]|nr:hypothetical protein [Syntrophaceae bacterium]